MSRRETANFPSCPNCSLKSLNLLHIFPDNLVIQPGVIQVIAPYGKGDQQDKRNGRTYNACDCHSLACPFLYLQNAKHNGNNCQRDASTPQAAGNQRKEPCWFPGCCFSCGSLLNMLFSPSMKNLLSQAILAHSLLRPHAMEAPCIQRTVPITLKLPGCLLLQHQVQYGNILFFNLDFHRLSLLGINPCPAFIGAVGNYFIIISFTRFCGGIPVNGL